MGEIIYQEKENKFIIIKNKQKRIFFGNLENLNIKQSSRLYLNENTFLYYQKNIKLNLNKKLSINELNKIIGDTNPINKGFIVGYNISNIFVNEKKEKYLLGKSGEISFNLGIYFLDNIGYTKLKKIWGNNFPNLYPKSIDSIKYLGNYYSNFSIGIFEKDKVKIINLEKEFYKNIEEIDIGLDNIKNKIKEIFGKDLENLNNLSSFHRKIYFKELNNFLEPIILFIKNNSIGDNFLLVGDFTKLPEFIQLFSKLSGKKILSITDKTKILKSQKDMDLYFINKI